VKVDEALTLARSHGVRVTLDGNDLALDAEARPPEWLLVTLAGGKREIVAAPRLREAEERRRLVQWVNDHFASSPAGVCAHCGGEEPSGDPFVRLFVGNDRGEVHASCYPAWLAAREAEAMRALGSEARLAVGIAEPSSLRTWSPMMHRERDLNSTTRARRRLRSSLGPGNPARRWRAIQRHMNGETSRWVLP
jgi:hypothetical protein